MSNDTSSHVIGTDYQVSTSLADFLAEQNDLIAREAAIKASRIATVKSTPKPISKIKEEEPEPLPLPAPIIDFGDVNWIGKLTGMYYGIHCVKFVVDTESMRPLYKFRYQHRLIKS